MTNAETQTNEALRAINYIALDKAFEANEITVLEYRMQEAEIDAEYPTE